MADFSTRLAKLKDRRQGTQLHAALESANLNFRSYDNAMGLIVDTRPKEFYETLPENEKVRYVIGAMAQVDKKSTQISIDEGNRVADNLISTLGSNYDIHCYKKMQGSVALDIHIKHHSDVDMLIVIKNSVIVEKPALQHCNYEPCSDPRTMKDILKDLRSTSEEILPKSFPAVNVKKEGDKSIALEGGGLLRKVDIVPSCWYDSILYQIDNNKNEHERGVKIYHKGDHALIKNFPFKHIKLVNDKDEKYSGNLKCVVRFLKNIIADIDDDERQETAKKLSSYDLAAIGYHMNEELNIGYYRIGLEKDYARLKLVNRTKKFLERLRDNAQYRNSLDVPDGTRKIFNNTEKNRALDILIDEIGSIEFEIFHFLMKHFRSVN
ncbi:MAG: hypothetical protein PHN45_07305 [Methylococcales bacterium]|nr:hypothetical protein [Methylococcales bacterium]